MIKDPNKFVASRLLYDLKVALNQLNEHEREINGMTMKLSQMVLEQQARRAPVDALVQVLKEKFGIENPHQAAMDMSEGGLIDGY